MVQSRGLTGFALFVLQGVLLVGYLTLLLCNDINVFDHQIIAAKGGRYMVGGSGAIKCMGWGGLGSLPVRRSLAATTALVLNIETLFLFKDSVCSYLCTCHFLESRHCVLLMFAYLVPRCPEPWHSVYRIHVYNCFHL